VKQLRQYLTAIAAKCVASGFMMMSRPVTRAHAQAAVVKIIARRPDLGNAAAQKDAGKGLQKENVRLLPRQTQQAGNSIRHITGQECTREKSCIIGPALENFSTTA